MREINAIKEFLKELLKVLFKHKEEILGFIGSTGIALRIILKPQNVELFSVYGWGFLILIAILKVTFGIELPLTHNIKTKIEKYFIVVNDQYKDKGIKKLYKLGGKAMKELLKWVRANWVTISGILAALGFLAEDIWNLSEYWKVSDEWYYTVIGAIYVFILWAIRGRGFEPYEMWKQIKDQRKQLRDDKKVQKQIEKAQKIKRFLDLANTKPNTQPNVETRQTDNQGVQIRRRDGR